MGHNGLNEFQQGFFTMIEERARVVALEPGAVWVETLRQSACGSCAAQKGCGQSAIARMSEKPMHVRALTGLHAQASHYQYQLEQYQVGQYQVGDEVIIGIPEDILLKSSLVAYLMPLIFALVSALSVQAINPADGWVTLGGAGGLALGFVGVWLHAQRVKHDPRYHPQVIRYADTASLVSRHSGCESQPARA